MTKDEVIRMAVKCQLVNSSNREGIYMDALESLAKLVAAAEREACAQAAELVVPRHTECGNKIARAIRARGDQ